MLAPRLGQRTGALRATASACAPLPLPLRRPPRPPPALRRSLATAPPPPPAPPGGSAPLTKAKRVRFYRSHPYWTALLAAPFVVTGSLGVALLGLWAWDASTFHHPHAANVPIDPLALNPKRGGKKNLKIAESLVDDLDARKVNSSGKAKKRLVIVGGGWGSVGIVKNLDPDVWHVTVVSPDKCVPSRPSPRGRSLHSPISRRNSVFSVFSLCCVRSQSHKLTRSAETDIPRPQRPQPSARSRSAASSSRSARSLPASVVTSLLESA